MHQIKRTLLVAVLAIGLASPAVYGEFYQYIDINGIQRFTDDIANVPQNQRPDVKIHQSVNSRTTDSDPRVQVAGNGSLASMSPSADASPAQTGAWHEKVASQGAELDRIQVELHKSYRSLQAERDALSGKAPPAGASSEAVAAYRQQVDQLNHRIKDYEARYTEFRVKEKAFNDQYRK